MDPIAHPSFFFRKIGEYDHNTSLGGFVQKVVSNIKMGFSLRMFLFDFIQQEKIEKAKLEAKKFEYIIKDEILRHKLSPRSLGMTIKPQ